MARILIIEDDPIYLDMIQEALAAADHEVVTAENGREGIERAQAYLPDLVISDVAMDGADGYTVLSTLRGQPSTAAIPFIMITGWSSKGGQRQGMSMGADDYLAKPFNATELLDTVSARLRLKEESFVRVARQSAAAAVGVSAILPGELRTPLQTITGLAEVIERDVESLGRGEIGDMARHMLAAASRIGRWVDNFTVHARLRELEAAADEKVALPDNALGDVAGFLESRARSLAMYRGREDDLRLNLRPGTLRMKESYLAKIVDELLDNAFKFSPPGAAVELMCAFTSDRFGMAVTDAGKGMSQHEVAAVHAFVQFGRLEYGQAGLGLGLHVARQIASVHGGALSIKSKPGSGTRVSVEVPRRA